jgi:hypothetical protein
VDELSPERCTGLIMSAADVGGCGGVPGPDLPTGASRDGTGPFAEPAISTG